MSSSLVSVMQNYIRSILSKANCWDIITPHAQGIIGFIRPEGVLMLPQGVPEVALGSNCLLQLLHLHSTSHKPSLTSSPSAGDLKKLISSFSLRCLTAVVAEFTTSLPRVMPLSLILEFPPSTYRAPKKAFSFFKFPAIVLPYQQHCLPPDAKSAIRG